MKAIAESIIERSQLISIIDNTKKEIRYLKYARKHGIYTPGIVEQKAIFALNELKKIEFLADKYKELFGEQFYKLKHNTEKLIKL